MPNKQTRTQVKRSKRGRSSATNSAAGPVWATGKPATELKSFFANGSNYQLYHNTAVAMTNVLNLLDSIPQGVGYTQRIGARIFLKKIRAHIVFNNKADRPNVSYRVAVTAAPVSTNTDTFIELFNGLGFTGIHVPTNSHLLYDVTFPLNQGSGMDNNVTPNKERTFNHSFDIPVNRSVVYNSTDSKATTSLSVWFVAYDAYGTLTSDNIASVAQVSWAADFTDS